MTSHLLEEKKFMEGPGQFPFSCDIQQVSGEGFHYSAHWHQHIELIYVFCGRAQFSVGGAAYELLEGELLLINAHEVHSVRVHPGVHAKYLVISCIPEILYNTSSTVLESKYILPFLVDSHSLQRYFPEEKLLGTHIPAMMQQFNREFTEKPYGFELAIRSDMMRLFLWILREWQSAGSPVGANQSIHSRYAGQFAVMFDHMRRHYNEPLSPNEAARMCNMSYSHFARIFKAVTGKTFNEYLNYLRISEAEKLLLTTELNVTEIAQRTGFSLSSYFIKQFKAYRHVSPKQFKRQQQRPSLL